MPRDTLSSLDYTVLGIVWREGQCTTYTVMLRLAKSPSSLFRKRASSTYSVAQKLTRMGMLESVGDAGTRGDRPIKLSEHGEEVLRDWLTPPLPDAEIAYSNDLVRLRLNFIACLDLAGQQAMVTDALARLESLEKEQARTLTERGDPTQSIALVGLLYETRARIEWLRYVLSILPIAPPARS